jgi:hypothetical protein
MIHNQPAITPKALASKHQQVHLVLCRTVHVVVSTPRSQNIYSCTSIQASLSLQSSSQPEAHQPTQHLTMISQLPASLPSSTSRTPQSTMVKQQS